MRRLTVLSICIFAAVAGAAITVGSGAQTALIAQAFVTSYNRGTFSAQVSAPSNNVTPLVAQSLVQLFTSKADNSNTYALIMPDQTAANPVVWQVFEDIYKTYSSLGASAAGVPTMDTTACPVTSFGICDYQIFTSDYAFFAYSTPSLNVTLKDPYYTAWNAAGGISGSFGAAISATGTVTSPVSTVAGTQQSFISGTIFSYPNSSATPSIYGLGGSFFSVYSNANGSATLGFPTSAAVVNPTTGLTQQTFEGGKIQQASGADPVVIYPLGQINIVNANQGLTLAAGSTATLTAVSLDSQQNIVTGRVLNWSSSNGAVATVVGNGYAASVTGVSAGAANIYVTGEGKTSPALLVTVGAGCCAIGQGAPSQTLVAAFQSAATRNLLPASTTALGTVVRSGAGYVQLLNASGVTYAIAEADGSSTAYVIGGAFYSAYLAAGGFAGPMGYPTTDLLAGNAQKFASGAALAGIPPLVIPAAIAPKWFLNQAAAGMPSAPAVSFSTFTGTGGVSQSFAGGSIFAVTSAGSLAGQPYFSTGAILSRYMALLGTAGALGAPLSDVYSNAGVLTENFEGGYITQQPGAAAAVEHFNPRTPSLSFVPSSVAPGGKVHITASGFAPGANLAFAMTGQSNFSVTVAAGAFSWDVIVPSSAKAASVSITVTDSGSKDTATGSYSVVAPAALLPAFKVASGDLQSGYPSSLLPLPIVAVLVDSSGNPMPNIPVLLTTSPGALASGSAVTDSQGRVVVSVRLPAQPGIATGSISAGGAVVTFTALGSAGSLPAFTGLAATSQQTTLVSSLASALLYYQNNGILPASAGAANTGALTTYLTAQNAFALSDTGDSIPNPWVAAQFASGSLNVQPATQNQIRDLIAAGSPAIVNLSITVDGKPGGGAAVDAVGFAQDGSILIYDPNPATAQTALNAYLNGFSSQGHSYAGAVSSVLSISPAQYVAGAAPFTISSPLTSASSLASSGVACTPVDLAGPTSPGGVRFQGCDGSASLYELDLAVAGGASVLDLTGGPGVQIPSKAGLRWKIARTNGVLSATTATLSISGVVDSAAFAASLAPNQLFSIFGTGFAPSGLIVTLGGKAVQTLSVSPLQINALIPSATAVAASTPLAVTSAGTTATSNVAIVATAPGIFLAGSLGAILNPDATLNSPSNPAQRGQYVSVYCTGLGATTPSGGLQVAATAVSVVVNGQTLKPSYAGAVAGFTGLYQVNVSIPSNMTPNPAAALQLTQGKSASNTVPLAVD